MQESKYAIPVKLEELDRLLETNTEEVIWTQKLQSKWVFVNLFIQLVIAGLWIYHYRDMVNVAISLSFVLPAMFLFYLSKTMRYSIYSNRIRFDWGIKSRAEIPFKNITAINLVSYKDSEHSTIYFGTNKKYKVRKINFDDNDTRAHITFENVQNGTQVVELLNLLWQRNRNLV